MLLLEYFIIIVVQLQPVSKIHLESLLVCRGRIQTKALTGDDPLLDSKTSGRFSWPIEQRWSICTTVGLSGELEINM